MLTEHHPKPLLYDSRHNKCFSGFNSEMAQRDETTEQSFGKIYLRPVYVLRDNPGESRITLERNNEKKS